MKISKLILGGNIFGYSCDKNQTINLIRTSLEVGVNSIDTADVYVNGLSELYIGEAIQENRDKFFIATKIGANSGENFDRKGSFLYMNNAIHGSLKRLKTDYIDLYQLHHFDKFTNLEETISTFELFKKQGKIINYGFSNLTLLQYHCLTKYISKNLKDSNIFLQVPYNLFRREIDDYLQIEPKFFNIIIYGVLARGILSDKYLKLEEIDELSRANLSKSVKLDLNIKIINVLKNLDIFSKKRNLTISQSAITWALNNSKIDHVIIGVRNINQLLKNYETLNIKFNEDDIKELDKILGDLDTYKAFNLGYINPYNL